MERYFKIVLLARFYYFEMKKILNITFKSIFKIKNRKKPEFRNIKNESSNHFPTISNPFYAKKETAKNFQLKTLKTAFQINLFASVYLQSVATAPRKC